MFLIVFLRIPLSFLVILQKETAAKMSLQQSLLSLYFLPHGVDQCLEILHLAVEGHFAAGAEDEAAVHCHIQQLIAVSPHFRCLCGWRKAAWSWHGQISAGWSYYKPLPNIITGLSIPFCHKSEKK